VLSIGIRTYAIQPGAISTARSSVVNRERSEIFTPDNLIQVILPQGALPHDEEGAAYPLPDQYDFCSHGVIKEVVQKRLGHSNIGVTMDTYTHVAPGIGKAAALTFEDGLNSAKPQPVTLYAHKILQSKREAKR